MLLFYVVVSLGKTLNVNFLTRTLCGMEDSTSVCFTTAYIPGKKIKNQIKSQLDLMFSVSSKVGLGNNCAMLNVYDVVHE